MKYIASFLLVFAFCIPAHASAETVVRIGQDIVVDANQVVEGDYYVSVGPFGNTTMSGEVTGDMYAFGGMVTANGAITNDLTIIGGSAQLHATVTDDVRIVAGEVTVAEHVGGDLFVIAGVLKILSTATIDGDVIFFGGSAEIDGTVSGSILGTSQTMRVDATVAKNIDVKTTQALTLGDTAVVGGYVTYKSLNPLVRGQHAVVQGEVHQASVVSENTDESVQYNRAAFIPAFITLFTTLSLFLLFRRELTVLVARIHSAVLKSALFGISVVLLGPLVSVVLMATVLGLFIGILSLATITIMYILGYALSGVVLGSYLAKWFTNHPTVSLLWVVCGSLVLQALLFIPVFGVTAVIVIFAITVGGIVVSLYSSFS